MPEQRCTEHCSKATFYNVVVPIAPLSIYLCSVYVGRFFKLPPSPTPRNPITQSKSTLINPNNQRATPFFQFRDSEKTRSSMRGVARHHQKTMDRTDVQHLLHQHGLVLTNDELSQVLFRLSHRAQQETIYGGPQTSETRPQPAPPSNLTNTQQTRPATSTQQRYRVPMTQTSSMIPKTAPSQSRRLQLVPTPSHSSTYSTASSTVAPSLTAAIANNTTANITAYTAATPTGTTINPTILVPQTEETSAIANAPNLNTFAGTTSTVPNLSNNMHPFQQPQQFQLQPQQLQPQQQTTDRNWVPRNQASKISQIAVNDRVEQFNLRINGDAGTRIRAPWQSQKKQYHKTPNTVVVGGLDAVFRMTNVAVVNIDQIREGGGIAPINKVLPPDVVRDPTTQRMVALPHQRKKMFDTVTQHNQNLQVPVATKESQPVESPRIVEIDARIANPLGGRKCFREEDQARHASGGWAVSSDYSDLSILPWSTTSKTPEISYRSPMAHRRIGKRELNPSWNGPTINGRIVVPIGPPGQPKGYGNSAANSPRLKYQRRVREMNRSLEGWNNQLAVDRTYTGDKKE